MSSDLVGGWRRLRSTPNDHPPLSNNSTHSFLYAQCVITLIWFALNGLVCAVYLIVHLKYRKRLATWSARTAAMYAMIVAVCIRCVFPLLFFVLFLHHPSIHPMRLVREKRENRKRKKKFIHSFFMIFS
eukprot:EC850346.1.p1 GENE.EC850346.1~~EC850346.1.p1  ORF type:complete len:129 (+),score=19.02 EC850346.1:37-423(+)